MNRALIVLSALLLNALFAGPRRLYLLLGVASISRLPAEAVHGLERRLNRDHRSESEREVRGLILVSAAGLASLVIGALAGWLFQRNFIELLVVTWALPVRPAWDIASGIRKRLRQGDVNGARQMLEGTAWKHHAVLDEYGVARAGIETLAIGFSEKVFAPVLWYVLFGLPGLFVSKTIYFLHETLAPDIAFGQAARMAHAILHYIPSRLAALLWLAASLFLPSSRPREIASQIGARLPTASPNRLALLSAAGVLKLALGGPVSIYAKEWQGVGSARPQARDIRRALTVYALMLLLLFILVGLLF